jgi:hypothetical protein
MVSSATVGGWGDVVRKAKKATLEGTDGKESSTYIGRVLTYHHHLFNFEDGRVYCM